MGGIMKAVTGLLGGKTEAKMPAATEVLDEEEKKKTKKARTQLFETEGGVLGGEVGEVGKRDNLFGN